MFFDCLESSCGLWSGKVSAFFPALICTVIIHLLAHSSRKQRINYGNKMSGNKLLGEWAYLFNLLKYVK